jgi:hypothetical protein
MPAAPAFPFASPDSSKFPCLCMCVCRLLHCCSCDKSQNCCQNWNYMDYLHHIIIDTATKIYSHHGVGDLPRQNDITHQLILRVVNEISTSKIDLNFKIKVALLVVIFASFSVNSLSQIQICCCYRQPLNIHSDEHSPIRTISALWLYPSLWPNLQMASYRCKKATRGKNDNRMSDVYFSNDFLRVQIHQLFLLYS